MSFRAWIQLAARAKLLQFNWMWKMLKNTALISPKLTEVSRGVLSAILLSVPWRDGFFWCWRRLAKWKFLNFHFGLHLNKLALFPSPNKVVNSPLIWEMTCASNKSERMLMTAANRLTAVFVKLDRKS